MSDIARHNGRRGSSPVRDQRARPSILRRGKSEHVIVATHDSRGKFPMLSELEKLPDNDTYYMGVAVAVREKANCTGNRVGAIAVLHNRIISTGYNGVPEGMQHCLEGGCLRCRNPEGRFPSGTGYDLCICVHAEQNVLLAAARFGIAVEGATIYSTMEPCFGCAKEMIQAKISRVVYLHQWAPTDADPNMDASKKAEYEKLLTRLGTKQLFIRDRRAKWAVSTLRRKS